MKSSNRMPTYVVTGKVRASFVYVITPHLNQGNGKMERSITLLIPKSDAATLQRLMSALEAAKRDHWPDGRFPPNMTNPIYDGDGQRQDGTPFGSECQGHWVVRAKAHNRIPEVVDINRNPILDPYLFKSGDYCRVSLNAFGFNKAGKQGVSFGLNNVQKLEDGEPLGSYVSAQEDFDDEYTAGGPPQGYPQPGYPPQGQPQAPQYPPSAYAPPRQYPQQGLYPQLPTTQYPQQAPPQGYPQQAPAQYPPQGQPQQPQQPPPYQMRQPPSPYPQQYPQQVPPASPAGQANPSGTPEGDDAPF